MRRIILLISVVVVLIGICILSYSIYQDYKYQKEDEIRLNEYFEKYENIEELSTEVETEKKSETSDISKFVAVLEVPSISLKTGVVMSNDNYTTMNRNVSIYPTSNMPDEENGNFVLFAHNGNSRVSYFKNIHILNYDDVIYIYYNNQKYTYKISDKYDVYMLNRTPLKKKQDKSVITLITCKKGNSDYRTVVVGDLVV